MTDLRQHQITSSSPSVGRRSNSELSPRQRERSAWLAQQMVSIQLGTLRIVGEPWLDWRTVRRQYWQVDVVCAACSRETSVYVDNVMSRKTTGCMCFRAVKHNGTKGSVHENYAARRLAERYDAIKGRCRNPLHESYANYGGRGIELRFSNRADFVAYCLEHLPHPTYLGVQIDREDNDRHYEPGNLRLVTALVNLRNMQRSQKIEYHGTMVNASDLWHLLKTDFPEMTVGPHRIAKLVALGRPWEEMVLIKGRPRSGSMISTTPDPDIVSLYRGS
jgi:hypothetical protein